MYASGMSYTGVASVSPTPGTPIGARNGLSVDSGGFAVLGANAFSTGEQFLNNRFIDFAAFTLVMASSTNNVNSGAFFQLFSVSFNDMPGGGFNGQVIVIPAGNQTLTGGAGQDFTQVNATGAYNFTGGSGKQADFRTASAWNPSAGSISYHAFADDGGMAVTGGSGDYVSFFSDILVNLAAPATGKVRGFYFNPNVGLGFPPAGQFVAIENTFGDVLLCSNNINGVNDGRVGISLGVGVSPTANLHLGAGTTNAGHALLKFTAGAILPIPEDGAWEYDGGRLFFTFTGGDRESVLTGQVGVAPAAHAAIALANFRGVDGSIYLAEPDVWFEVRIGGSVVKVPGYF